MATIWIRFAQIADNVMGSIMEEAIHSQEIIVQAKHSETGEQAQEHVSNHQGGINLGKND